MCRGSFLITAQPEKATWQNLFRAFSDQNFGTRYHVKGFQRFWDCKDLAISFLIFFLHRPPQIRVLTHNEDNNILQQASLQTIIGAKFGHTALPGVSKKKGETCIGKHYVWLYNPTVSMPWNDFRLLIFWLQ